MSYAVANGNTIWVRASAADTGGAYTLIEGHHIAGTGTPLHTHDAEDETFWIAQPDEIDAIGRKYGCGSFSKPS